MTLRSIFPAIALIAAVSCTDDTVDLLGENTGSVQLAATGGESHDVTQFEFKIVEDGGDCLTGTVVASAVVALEEEGLPPNLGGGDAHAFADALFVLPPGPYLACATPLQSDLSPSAECQPANDSLTVDAQLTTEVVLVSQCVGDDTGAVDVVGALNDPPRIDGLGVSPSKFIQVCESADITVAASDVNNDALSYNWAVTAQPAGSVPVIAPAGASATFDTDTVGDYEVTVTVTDEHTASTQLTFPIHVSPGSCVLASCGEILQDDPLAPSGTYTIAPSGTNIDVFCDMTTDGGGWTLVLKTDMSSAAHNTAAAVNAAAIATDTLNTVAKLSDADVVAVQTATLQPFAETRSESPSLGPQVMMRLHTWSVPTPASYSTSIETKLLTDPSWGPGMLCYDTDCAPSDHFCWGEQIGPLEHTCVRRFNSPGLWFNGGAIAPSYHPGRIWVR